jgi:hypothetical protein
MKNFRAADKSHAGGDEKHDTIFIGLMQDPSPIYITGDY